MEMSITAGWLLGLGDSDASRPLFASAMMVTPSISFRSANPPRIRAWSSAEDADLVHEVAAAGTSASSRSSYQERPRSPCCPSPDHPQFQTSASELRAFFHPMRPMFPDLITRRRALHVDPMPSSWMTRLRSEPCASTPIRTLAQQVAAALSASWAMR